jgi:hypothetical protein
VTPSQIMKTLMQLNPGICLKYRDTFEDDDPRVWYVSMSRVDWQHARSGNQYAPLVEGFDGPTPDIALHNAWTTLMEYLKDQDCFLRVISCPSDVPIPGDDPQSWVTWDFKNREWVDVVPTWGMLNANNAPEGRVIPYRALRHRLTAAA